MPSLTRSRKFSGQVESPVQRLFRLSRKVLAVPSCTQYLPPGQLPCGGPHQAIETPSKPRRTMSETWASTVAGSSEV